jgi:hypothetical protein
MLKFLEFLRDGLHLIGDALFIAAIMMVATMIYAACDDYLKRKCK